MKKEELRKADMMNIQEQYNHYLFNILNYENVSEEDCRIMLNLLKIVEKCVLAILDKQGIDVDDAVFYKENDNVKYVN